jgi:hypothetical protein
LPSTGRFGRHPHRGSRRLEICAFSRLTKVVGWQVAL